jgi:hypothetical protein
MRSLLKTPIETVTWKKRKPPERAIGPMRQFAACVLARLFLARSLVNPAYGSVRMLILALDPGLAAFGAALVDAESGELVDVDVFPTAPNTIAPTGKRREPKPGQKRKRRRLPVVGGMARDMDRRTLELAAGLISFALPHRPAAAVAESSGGSALGFTAAIALGAANAIAAIAVGELGIELDRVTVKAWRRTYVPGKNKISDEELYDAIGKSTCERISKMLIARGRLGSLWVHAADALAIGRWARNFSSPVRRACGIDVGGL